MQIYNNNLSNNYASKCCHTGVQAEVNAVHAGTNEISITEADTSSYHGIQQKLDVLDLKRYFGKQVTEALLNMYMGLPAVYVSLAHQESSDRTVNLRHFSLHFQLSSVQDFLFFYKRSLEDLFDEVEVRIGGEKVEFYCLCPEPYRARSIPSLRRRVKVTDYWIRLMLQKLNLQEAPIEYHLQ